MSEFAMFSLVEMLALMGASFFCGVGFVAGADLWFTDPTTFCRMCVCDQCAERGQDAAAEKKAGG